MSAYRASQATARRPFTLASAALACLLLSACSATGNSTTASSTAAAANRANDVPTLPGPPRPAGGHGLEAFIGGYDANRDGVVTYEEYMTIREARFRDADTNGDGYLDEAEYVAEFTQRLKQQYADAGREPDADYENSLKQAHVRFGVLDRDRDGRLSPEENRAVAERTFQQMDTNGDGRVTRDEPPRQATGGVSAQR